MKIKINTVLVVLLSCLLAGSTHATTPHPFQTIEINLPLNSTDPQCKKGRLCANTPVLPIQIPLFTPSAKMQQHLLSVLNRNTTPTSPSQRTHHTLSTSSAGSVSNGLPTAVDLGMNGVPVLNQGLHGTCATFANIAAVDAAMGWGDQISPLCHLALGQHLSKHGYLLSGWDGNTGSEPLIQMLSFGIVKKSKERTHHCGQMRTYPTDRREKSGEMTLEEFSKISQDISEQITWHPITGITNVNSKTHDYMSHDIVTDLKMALARRHRVTLGYALFPHHGYAGATGHYHGLYTTYVFSRDIMFAIFQLPFSKTLRKSMGAHEIVLTGYDDQAVAIDHNGTKHVGLFKFRNSWSKDAGDHGDYYMSYDYLDGMHLDAREIIRVKTSHA